MTTIVLNVPYPGTGQRAIKELESLVVPRVGESCDLGRGIDFRVEAVKHILEENKVIVYFAARPRSELDIVLAGSKEWVLFP